MSGTTATVLRTKLEPPAGFRSPEVALWFAGLEDQGRRLIEGVRGADAAELGWQPAPGANTMGMLLAHIAVAEVHITDVALARREDSRVPEVLGIRVEDDGMPLPDDGAPPAALAGRELPFFEDLLRRARAHTRAIASALGDDDLGRERVRQRPDGTTRVFDPRWMLYHLVEHEAGHHGQILMLRRLYRARRGG